MVLPDYSRCSIWNLYKNLQSPTTSILLLSKNRYHIMYISYKKNWQTFANQYLKADVLIDFIYIKSTLFWVLVTWKREINLTMVIRFWSAKVNTLYHLRLQFSVGVTEFSSIISVIVACTKHTFRNISWDYTFTTMLNMILPLQPILPGIFLEWKVDIWLIFKA